MEALVAALLLAELGLEELAHVAALAQAPFELLEERGVARDEARFHEARVDGHVLRRFLDTLTHAAHAVAGLEAAVPERADEALDRGIGLAPVREQHEHVDVGMRKNRAAPVAADHAQADLGAVDRLLPHALGAVVGHRPGTL